MWIHLQNFAVLARKFKTMNLEEQTIASIDNLARAIMLLTEQVKRFQDLIERMEKAGK